MRTLQGDCAAGCQVRLSSTSSFLPPKTAFLTHDVPRFSNTYPDARFYKLDVDEVPDVAQELGIRAMPTFLLFKNGDKVDEVVGANPKALENAIKKNLGEAAPAA